MTEKPKSNINTNVFDMDKKIDLLTPGQMVRHKMLRHYSFLWGAFLVAAILMLALFAPIISQHDPYQQNLSERLVNPIWFQDGTWDHPLGTDNLGRDYFSRIIYGARISLIIGVAATLISGIIGSILGVAAGYFGGRVDMFVSFLIAVRLSMPTILVALAVVALIGSSLNVVILVLGFLLWDRFAVVLRSSTQQIRSIEFVKAAKATGCSTTRIILTEIFPNIIDNFIVVVTLEISRAILVESSLSFLGMGVQPPLPSWGLMVSEGKELMFFNPFLVTIPGVALLILIMAFNLIGDGIRDIIAPEGH